MIELYNRPFEIYTEDARKSSPMFDVEIYRLIVVLAEPLNIFQENYSTDNPSIKLSYHQGNHYNSVRDPNNPAFGVGLGMPDLKPGVSREHHIFSRPINAHV